MLNISLFIDTKHTLYLPQCVTGWSCMAQFNSIQSNSVHFCPLLLMTWSTHTPNAIDQRIAIDVSGLYMWLYVCGDCLSWTWSNGAPTWNSNTRGRNLKRVKICCFTDLKDRSRGSLLGEGNNFYHAPPMKQLVYMSDLFVSSFPVNWWKSETPVGRKQFHVSCVYLDLHALLQESLGLILHLQPGSADQQQFILNDLNAAEIHTLGQIVWNVPKQAQKNTNKHISNPTVFMHVHWDAVKCR